jgi:hypothetical protein
MHSGPNCFSRVEFGAEFDGAWSLLGVYSSSKCGSYLQCGCGKLLGKTRIWSLIMGNTKRA